MQRVLRRSGLPVCQQNRPHEERHGALLARQFEQLTAREEGCSIHLNAPMHVCHPRIGPCHGDRCSHGTGMQDVDQTFEGDNSVMMQQVSKALLGAATKTPPVLSTPSVTDSSLSNHCALLQLLQFR